MKGENKKEQKRTCQTHREDSLFQPVDLRAGPRRSRWTATLSITIAMLLTCLLSYRLLVRNSIERSILDQLRCFHPLPTTPFLSLFLCLSSAFQCFSMRGACSRERIGITHRLNLSRLNRNWTILTRCRKIKRERERWRVTVIITTALMTFARHHGGGPMTTGKQL